LEGTQIYVCVPWGVEIGYSVETGYHYEEVIVNYTRMVDLAGDHVLDVAGTLDHLKVSPSSLPFFQSFYALTDGITGEQRVVEG
jgi:hypothetical protein